jgi:hypothetical protein
MDTPIAHSAISMPPLFKTVLLVLVVLLARSAPAQTVPATEHFFKRTYIGQIHGKYPFTMELMKAGGVLRGSYRYAGKNQDIGISGKVEPSGAFTLQEGTTAKSTGSFSGTIDAGKITGMWISPGGGRKQDFAAMQTAEADMRSKAAILTQAAGVYVLEGISGSMGANGMYDTWKEGRTWRSNVSGISGGMRQASAVRLTRGDLTLLNSISVTVDAALTTRLHASGKVVLEIPFTPTGMQYNISKPHNSVVTDQFARYGPDQSIVGDALVLLVRDEVDYNAALSGSFELQAGDIVTVSYLPMNNAFSVSFREGSCCGGAGLSFRKK